MLFVVLCMWDLLLFVLCLLLSRARFAFDVVVIARRIVFEIVLVLVLVFLVVV